VSLLSSWWNEATATAMFTTKPKSVSGCVFHFLQGVSVTVTRRVSAIPAVVSSKTKQHSKDQLEY